MLLQTTERPIIFPHPTERREMTATFIIRPTVIFRCQANPQKCKVLFNQIIWWKLKANWAVLLQLIIKRLAHNTRLVIDWTPVWILIHFLFFYGKMFCLYHSQTHTITDTKLFSGSFWHILSLISLLITLLSLIYQHVCTASSLLGSIGLTRGLGSGQILRSMLTSLCSGSRFRHSSVPMSTWQRYRSEAECNVKSVSSSTEVFALVICMQRASEQLGISRQNKTDGFVIDIQISWFQYQCRKCSPWGFF